MKASEKVVRMVCIPYVDEKPKRHTWYLYHAKIGTTASTVIWVADKPELHVGDWVDAFEVYQYDMADKKKYVQYPSTNALIRGMVDKDNDYIVFIKKI